MGGTEFLQNAKRSTPEARTLSPACLTRTRARSTDLSPSKSAAAHRLWEESKSEQASTEPELACAAPAPKAAIKTGTKRRKVRSSPCVTLWTGSAWRVAAVSRITNADFTMIAMVRPERRPERRELSGAKDPVLMKVVTAENRILFTLDKGIANLKQYPIGEHAGVMATGVQLSLEASTNERIDDAHAGVREIRTVSRGDCQTMDDCRRCDEATLNRHRFPAGAKTRQQVRPFQARVRVPGQTLDTPHARVKPAFQRDQLPSLGKDENSESQFAQNHGIDHDVPLTCSKPLHNSRIGRRFRRFTQNTGVDQVFHSASVDSESMGTKKSFCGQAHSQSTTPALFGASRRMRR